MKQIWMILTGKASLIDVYHYFVGHYRYKLFYAARSCKIIDVNTGKVLDTRYYRHPLMRSHIYHQIIMRLEWMDKECYDQGACKICGCQTTQLQMANKACDKPCYPAMMSRKEWEHYFEAYKATKDIWNPLIRQ